LVLVERGQFAQAAKLFEKAANQGLPQAQQQLALLYKDGKGVPADKFQAYIWMLVSYDSGNASILPTFWNCKPDWPPLRSIRRKQKPVRWSR